MVKIDASIDQTVDQPRAGSRMGLVSGPAAELKRPVGGDDSGGWCDWLIMNVPIEVPRRDDMVCHSGEKLVSRFLRRGHELL